MRKEVLIALIDKWHKDSEEPTIENGSPEAEIGNAIAKGERKAMRKCCQDLSTLISLLSAS